MKNGINVRVLQDENRILGFCGLLVMNTSVWFTVDGYNLKLLSIPRDVLLCASA